MLLIFGGIQGIIDPGYGYIMGFYIIPEQRRKGFGRTGFNYIESVLKTDSANFIYLTPDSITGVRFWKAIRFSDSGKVDPDDYLPIYIKELLI
ncbi:MAG: GNAT family N-acetyltransferase [Firmicutes bacterium]|nr:GNAT family N-acetyltransferase [Bacillota bacterium]